MLRRKYKKFLSTLPNEMVHISSLFTLLFLLVKFDILCHVAYVISLRIICNIIYLFIYDVAILCTGRIKANPFLLPHGCLRTNILSWFV